jgi:hypothetical protein
MPRRQPCGRSAIRGPARRRSRRRVQRLRSGRDAASASRGFGSLKPPRPDCALRMIWRRAARSAARLRLHRRPNLLSRRGLPDDRRKLWPGVYEAQKHADRLQALEGWAARRLAFEFLILRRVVARKFGSQPRTRSITLWTVRSSAICMLPSNCQVVEESATSASTKITTPPANTPDRRHTRRIATAILDSATVSRISRVISA